MFSAIPKGGEVALVKPESNTSGLESDKVRGIAHSTAQKHCEVRGPVITCEMLMCKKILSYLTKMQIPLQNYRFSRPVVLLKSLKFCVSDKLHAVALLLI